MSEIRYLMDENVNPLLRREILRREPNLTVWQVGMLGAPAYGTLDPEILIWCEENDFILVTNNRKSMPVHLNNHLAEDRHLFGIFSLNENISVGETIDELILIALATSAEDYQDQIIYLPIT
jgi:Domain of unknown function (DUF5615)